MVGDILQPTHLVFVLVVALLVLGPKRLPEVGRQLGNGLRDFRAAGGSRQSAEARAQASTISSGECGGGPRPNTRERVEALRQALLKLA